MVVDSLQSAERYFELHRRFPAAFDFLRSPGVGALPSGRHSIDGDNLFAIVSQGPARTRAEARLEAHRKYIDIQMVLKGTDEMGWKTISACRVGGGYDDDRDVQFFDDSPSAWVAVTAGTFCIFFPTDCHAPLVGEGTIHKVVVKVAV